MDRLQFAADWPVLTQVTVVVDRQTWLRGEGPDRSRLLRAQDGKMCCLGSACLALGATRSDILGFAGPLSVPSTKAFAKQHAATMRLLMVENDSMATTDAQKETAIIALGAAIGLQFSFIN